MAGGMRENNNSDDIGVEEEMAPRSAPAEDLFGPGLFP